MEPGKVDVGRSFVLPALGFNSIKGLGIPEPRELFWCKVCVTSRTGELSAELAATGPVAVPLNTGAPLGMVRAAVVDRAAAFT